MFVSVLARRLLCRCRHRLHPQPAYVMWRNTPLSTHKIAGSHTRNAYIHKDSPVRTHICVQLSSRTCYASVWKDDQGQEFVSACLVTRRCLKYVCHQLYTPFASLHCFRWNMTSVDVCLSARPLHSDLWHAITDWPCRVVQHLLICVHLKKEGLRSFFDEHSLSDVNWIAADKPLLENTHMSHTIRMALVREYGHVCARPIFSGQTITLRTLWTYNAVHIDARRPSPVYSFTIHSITTIVLFTWIVPGESVYLRTWPFRMCTPWCTHTLSVHTHTNTSPWCKCHSQFGVSGCLQCPRRRASSPFVWQTNMVRRSHRFMVYIYVCRIMRPVYMLKLEGYSCASRCLLFVSPALLFVYQFTLGAAHYWVCILIETKIQFRKSVGSASAMCTWLNANEPIDQ